MVQIFATTSNMITSDNFYLLPHPWGKSKIHIIRSFLYQIIRLPVKQNLRMCTKPMLISVALNWLDNLY